MKRRRNLFILLVTMLFALPGGLVRAAVDPAVVQKLLASDKAADDEFGWSVDGDGDTAVIGAKYADPAGLSNAGAAYVFTRSGTSWTQQAKLTAADKAKFDLVGGSVSVSGDTAVIGATGAAPNSGAAYVFTRSGTSWTQQAKLLADDKAAGDQFGGSVSVSGNTVMIGAFGANPDGLSGAGAVYIYKAKDMP